MIFYRPFVFLPFLVALTLARPSGHSVHKRTLTPDNTCGNTGVGANNGYTCNPNLPLGGSCCSHAGWCGNTAAYCGDGCQSAFGNCQSIPNPGLQPSSGSQPNPSLTVPQIGCVWAVPQVGSFTHAQSFDFSKLTAFPSTGLDISTDTIGAGTAPFSQLYTTSNVAITGGTLQLKVPGGQTASPILGAEIYTTDKDILYGSVRTTAQISNVAGTTHGFFFYKDEGQETDIEINTAYLNTGIHYTNQNHVPGQLSTSVSKALPSDATIAMHEYRLDWLPGKTIYYIDGVEQIKLTENMPDVPGEWLWVNWSNGDKWWTAGPPLTDNVLKISKIEMYYNRTGSAGTC